MSAFFVDSSALGRRYLPEVGSAWVRSWIHNNTIIIAQLATIEMFATFARLQGENKLRSETAITLRNAVLFHTENEYQVILLDSPVIERARIW